MMQHLLPKTFGEAVDDRKLDIVEAPQFEGIDYAAGQPLRSAGAVRPGSKLDIEFADGRVGAVAETSVPAEPKAPSPVRARRGHRGGGEGQGNLFGS